MTNNNLTQDEMNFKLDINRLSACQENMKFMKRFQLQIVYYTLLVYFGIAFFCFNVKSYCSFNISDTYIASFLLSFIVILFFVFCVYQKSLSNGMEATRKAESDIEKQYNYRKWRNMKYNRNKKSIIDKLYFWGYMFLTFLSAIFAGYSVILRFTKYL